MIPLELIFPLFLGFLAVLVGTPLARRYLISSGVYGVDQQKLGKPKVATSGGLIVLFGFVVSVTSFLSINSLLGFSTIEVSLVLAALNSASIIALIGLVDDIHIDIEKLINEHVEEEIEIELDYGDTHLVERFVRTFSDDKENDGMHRKGLSQLPKMLFVLPAAFPLIAVGAGSWTMNLPYIGIVNWGLFYPLVLLPVGLLFVSNVVNMLAGTNGLSASMSLVASIGLGVFAVINNRLSAALIAFSLAASLLGFLYYNRYPASILPGDSLTYLCGAALFSSMVIGDMEKFGVFVFLPWFIEFFLKARSSFKAHSWGKIMPDGTLMPQHSKNYSLTIPLMRRGFSERQITYLLSGFEAVIVIAGLLIFV